MTLQIELLEEIGLTKAEIKVYLSLLELGSSSTGPLVDKSGASSSKIYEILDKLMQKGLVSFIIKSGVKYFEAADPKRILDYLEEKQKHLQVQTDKVKQVLPELELKRTLSRYKSEATIYKGMKGLETAFQDILKTLKKGDTNYVYVVGKLDGRMNEFFKRHYNLRAKQGIKTKTIFSEAGREYYESRKNIPLFEGKVIGTTTSPATVNIYGTKVNLRMGASENVLSIVIDNKELADAFLEQFNLLWNQDTTVTKGMSALIQTLKGFLDDMKPGDTFDVLGAAFGGAQDQERYAQEFTAFHHYRQQKGITARWLFQQGTEEIIRKHSSNYQRGERKFLPYKTESPVSIHPYKNRTLLIIQGKEPTIISINSKEVTESFQRQFESLWNQDVRVYKGFNEVTSRFWSMLDEMNTDEEYQVLGASHGEGGQKLVDWFMRYHRERITRKIRARLLTTPKNYDAILPQLNQAPDTGMRLAELKLLSPELSTPMQINLYPQNKVLMFLWGKEPICFEIESEIMHLNFKTYFESLWQQQTKTYQGYEGLKMIITETLKYPEVLFIGAGGYVPTKMPQFWKEYNKIRLQRSILWRGLAREELLASPLPKEQLFEFKLMPKAYQSPNVVWIFGDKVVNIVWTEVPLAFAIENKEIAQSYREYFKYLWENVEQKEEIKKDKKKGK